MEGMEPYLQKSFQAVCDEGISSDHSFKFAKMITGGVRAGKVYKATYVAISQKGSVNMNRLCLTKNNDEIKPLVGKYREVRLNAGQPRLLRYECDGGGDRYVWLSQFPELQEGVKPYKPPTVDGLVRASILEEDYTVMVTPTEVNNWALSMSRIVANVNASEIYVGLDTENNVDETSSLTRTLQIAFPPDLFDKVVIVHLSKMCAFDRDSFPKELRKLLQLPKIIPCGVNIGHDMTHLQ